jgi:3-hydroxyacyl-[acyl-carrier protein] dehydratase/trans-2-decenoyl-[acyl-carrier protein] isomerase
LAFKKEVAMSTKDQNSFTYEELISCARGEMFGAGNPQLPLPPMLMCDRITNISSNGGDFSKGQIDAEFDLNPDYGFSLVISRAIPLCPDVLEWMRFGSLWAFFLDGQVGLVGGAHFLLER